MITLEEFKKIDEEVRLSVNQLLDEVKAKSQNYILLLANAESISPLYTTRWNPNVIDSSEDRSYDRTRREFFSDFMNGSYSFPAGTSIISDMNAIQLELMIYCHIWESKPFLKTLYRLSELVAAKSYPWNVEVPWSGKEDFIRNVIRDSFKRKKLDISTIMTNGFNSSLRNAFAHSDYYFSFTQKEIRLTNYTGKKWQLQTISFADWRKRFAYSALLSNHLLNSLYERRISVIKDFKRDTFPIVHPVAQNRVKIRYIRYNEEADHFNWVLN